MPMRINSAAARAPRKKIDDDKILPRQLTPLKGQQDDKTSDVSSQELTEIIGQLQALQNKLGAATASQKIQQEKTEAPFGQLAAGFGGNKIVPCGDIEENQEQFPAIPPVSRATLKKNITHNRRGRIPPFLAHPILAIGLFMFGSNPYTLISHRREYSAGVQHEFATILEDFKGIRDIDSFYTWFDISLTAESSFDKYFRTGEAADDFLLYATSNNTFNVLAITQSRDGCLAPDEVQGAGSDPTAGVPITEQNWRCGVASHQQCEDIPCAAAGGMFGGGVCILDMQYKEVNDPDKGLRTPQAPPNLTNYELAEQCVLQQFIHPNVKSKSDMHGIIPSTTNEQSFVLIPANLWHRNLSAVDIGTLFSKSMQDVHYIDVHTRSVTVTVIAHAQAFQKGSICLIEFTINFSMTGMVKPHLEIRPMVHFFEDEPYWPRLPYYLYLIYVAVSNVHEVATSFSAGLDMGREFLKESLIFVVVDVVLCMCSVIFYTSLEVQQGYQKETGDAYYGLLGRDYKYVFPSGCSSSTLTGDCNDQMDTATKSLSNAISTGQNVMRLAVVVMVLLTLRLFRYFRLQPELAVISNTIVRAAPNISNLILILCVINLGFAQCAVFAWGTQLDDFSTVFAAFWSMFMIMIGEFGDLFAEMAEVNEPLARLFMFLYILLCFIVAMNIFLAIVVDSYEEVKSEQGDYSQDETPNMLAGSLDQVGQATRRFVTRVSGASLDLSRITLCQFGPDSKIEKRFGLSWAEQVQFEKFTWADMSRALTKIEKESKDLGDDDELVPPEELAKALGKKYGRVVTLALAGALLCKYSKEGTSKRD